MERYSILFPTTHTSSPSPSNSSSSTSFHSAGGQSLFAGGSSVGFQLASSSLNYRGQVRSPRFGEHAVGSDPLATAAGSASGAGAAAEMGEGKTKTKKVRRPRHAFQTRSQVDILDDGYRWRKYGQKAVKNNKFPRSYYRCTHQGCGVKKQVQRLSRDESVVVTTYEGMHTHPIEKPSDNFEDILNQMQIFSNF